jgi:DnaJ-class molecular chaperone
MPPQLKRILPLFILFIILFLVVRSFLVPESFGEAGHYRFNSLDDNSNRELYYAGKQACAECHEEYLEYLSTDMHAGLSCETCHGPGLKHIATEDAANIQVPRTRELCGLCHGLNPTRKKDVVAQVDLKEHNVEQSCVECHNPHMPWEITE